LRVLGVSCDYHDAAAAVVDDGVVVAAAEEERFSRVKHDSSLPVRAIASCLANVGADASSLDAVVFYEQPLAVIGRVLAARQRRGPAAIGSFARDFPVLLRRNLLIGYRLERALRRLGATRAVPVRYSEHHLSHAAAAFHPSPFDTAAILTIDGIGELATATIGHGLRNRIELLVEQRFPHSIGLLYSLATIWCGFEANDGEYKLMGLAPYGDPIYTDALREIVLMNDDGSTTIDARRVGWWARSPHRMKQLVRAFEGPPRRPDQPITSRDLNLACSVQALLEDVVLRMADHAAEITGEQRLCMAGGVALNCVANGRLLREGRFDDIWVQPAAGDAGSAIGAALWYSHHEQPGTSKALRRPSPERLPDAMSGAQLGPDFGADEVSAWLLQTGIEHRWVVDQGDLCDQVAGRLAGGAVVGWFQGRMEFGPRSLGQRSILADPRSSTVREDINLRVKGRESFRPFAPAVLWEAASEWFEIDAPSPYMLFTFPVTAAHLAEVAVEPIDIGERARVVRSDIPACTHIDGSARVQTVHASVSPLFHALISSFERSTGCPVLLNTSFNVAGEPIVCTPSDALRTARRAGLDLLVIGDAIIELRREPNES